MYENNDARVIEKIYNSHRSVDKIFDLFLLLDNNPPFLVLSVRVSPREVENCVKYSLKHRETYGIFYTTKRKKKENNKRVKCSMTNAYRSSF